MGNSLPYLVEKLTQIRLNTSQLGVTISIISAVHCKHSNLVKLIWGPPGTGKMKTITATLGVEKFELQNTDVFSDKQLCCWSLYSIAEGSERFE